MAAGLRKLPLGYIGQWWPGLGLGEPLGRHSGLKARIIEALNIAIHPDQLLGTAVGSHLSLLVDQE